MLKLVNLRQTMGCLMKSSQKGRRPEGHFEKDAMTAVPQRALEEQPKPDGDEIDAYHYLPGYPLVALARGLFEHC